MTRQLCPRIHSQTALADVDSLYLPLKFISYAGVVLLGARGFKFAPEASLPWCSLVAAARMLIGLALALPIYFISTILDQQFPPFEGRLALIYILVYIPARWIAWSLTAPILNPRARTLDAVVAGVNSKDLQWRGLGVAVSCGLDVLLIGAFGMLPVGKFYC